ncbi:hypothetical protein KSP40_PGU004312 [Platanthera guangdongensis]|uniref:Uncharacterized protein n=1 Tax=Platanthera guangdongensis TaxID=2320717 RepID=A0ABR2MKH9_9ASPA
MEASPFPVGASPVGDGVAAVLHHFCRRHHHSMSERPHVCDGVTIPCYGLHSSRGSGSPMVARLPMSESPVAGGTSITGSRWKSFFNMIA